MIKRIVLTGGPSSGKTSVLGKIKQVYEQQGYRVVLIDETATYLIEKGIRPFGEKAMDLVDFQEIVMRMQLAKEEIFDRAIELLKEENVLIIYDRGAIDNSAYINAEQFEEVLARLNHVKTFAELMNKYDLVINLVGSKDFYTTENNEARSEDVENAMKLGENTLKAWMGHSKIKIVLPKPTMDEKINEVLNFINELLNKKQVKRQEKFIVDLSQTDLEKVKVESQVMQIEQSYLQSDETVEKRLRKVTFKNCISYYFSTYKRLENNERVIVSEKEIDEKVYEQLMSFKDDNFDTIHKMRYYFNYRGQYLYLDIFENNEELGMLEANVGENESVILPDHIVAIEKVSNNEKFYNKNLAMNQERKQKIKKI